MRVKEIAQKAGVSPEIVRYYVRIGLLKPSSTDKSGYRRFSASHLNILRFIMRAKQLGFTLSEIGEILRMAHRGSTPCPIVRDVVRRRVKDNKVDLEALRSLQARMENALARWEHMRDGVPDGDAICVLIESVT
ncbi:MAG: MerR family transcriptional regulator [Betaproteobacteria bacterium]